MVNSNTESDVKERGNDSSEQSSDDRRRHERYVFRADVHVTEFSPDGRALGTWACQTIDISRSGMALVSRRMVYAGRSLCVEFVVGEQSSPTIFHGVVRHAGYQEGVGHILGIEFTPLPNSHGTHQWLTNRGEAS